MLIDFCIDNIFVIDVVLMEYSPICRGTVIYTVPENHTVAVTLFKDSRTNELEDKDWTFVLEDVSVNHRRYNVEFL